MSTAAKRPAAAAGAGKPSGHPPFAEMISDAIVVLKERNGSSQVAIQKFIEEKYKHLPSTFRKLLLVQLKRMVAAGKLVRVKHSFKMAPSSKPKPKQPAAASGKEGKKSDDAGAKKRKAAEKAKPAAAAKVARTKKMTSPGKKAAAKPKKTVGLKKVKSPMKKATPKRAKAAKPK